MDSPTQPIHVDSMTDQRVDVIPTPADNGAHPDVVFRGDFVLGKAVHVSKTCAPPLNTPPGSSISRSAETPKDPLSQDSVGPLFHDNKYCVW